MRPAFSEARARRGLLAALLLAHIAPPWNVALLLSAQCGFDERPSCTAAARDVKRALVMISAIKRSLVDEDIRFRHGHPDKFPDVTMLVDVVPIVIHGNDEDYNGKYRCKVMKVEVCVTCQGCPVYWATANGRAHDSKTFNPMTDLAHYKNEKILGDAAYVGQRHVIAPHKRTRNQKALGDKQKAANKRLAWLRSRVERFSGFSIATESFAGRTFAPG